MAANTIIIGTAAADGTVANVVVVAVIRVALLPPPSNNSNDGDWGVILFARVAKLASLVDNDDAADNDTEDDTGGKVWFSSLASSSTASLS